MPEIVIYEIDGRRYGLPAADVRKLVRVVTIVPLPKAPDIIEGMINLRGKIVPVVDMRSRLRLPPRSVQPSDHLIIARTGERLLAFRVDRATEFVKLTADDVDGGPTPGMKEGAWIAKFGGELVLVHDLRNILSATELEALELALPASGAGTEEER